MSEKKDDQTLYWTFGNSLGYVGEVCICAEDKEVRIGVEDGYYNFQIPFDKFLKIAEKVKATMEAEENESERSKE